MYTQSEMYFFQKYFITFRICRGSEENEDKEAYDFADIG